jgi:hypothetical protein
MNEKGLMKFSVGMFALGQVLKKKNNKGKELFKKNNYYNPFRLPQMNHPVFGKLFTTTTKGRGDWEIKNIYHSKRYIWDD